MNALSLIESSSSVEGLWATDISLKTAAINCVFSRPISGGHHLLLLEGDVEDLRSAINAVKQKMTPRHVMFLANPHPELVEALFSPPEDDHPEGGPALGLLETSGIASGLESCDAMLKTGAVHLVLLTLGVGMQGQCLMGVRGDVGSVEASLDRARSLAEAAGQLVGHTLISRSHPQLKQAVTQCGHDLNRRPENTLL